MTEVCREMGLESEEDISEFGIFTFLEDREFLGESLSSISLKNEVKKILQ